MSKATLLDFGFSAAGMATLMNCGFSGSTATLVDYGFSTAMTTLGGFGFSRLGATLI